MITNSNLLYFVKMLGRGFQEAMLHHHPIGCLRNRQADPLKTNRETPKKWRFLLKRDNVNPFSFHVGASLRRCAAKTSRLNQQKLVRNEGISILSNMPIESFKKRKWWFGELIPKSPLKRQKWRRSYLGASEKVEQKTSVFVEHCTYNSIIKAISNIRGLRIESEDNVTAQREPFYWRICEATCCEKMSRSISCRIFRYRETIDSPFS